MWAPRRLGSPCLACVAFGVLLGAGCAKKKQVVVLPETTVGDTSEICARLQTKLRGGWRIAEVGETDVPKGWTRFAGSPGLRVHMTDPTTTVDHPILGPYHPTFTVWLMPRDWRGSEPMRNQHLRDSGFAQGPIRPDPDPDPDKFPAVYWGTNPYFHYLYMNVGMGPWKKAPVVCAKALSVTRWGAPASQPATQPSEKGAETDPPATEKDDRP